MKATRTSGTEEITILEVAQGEVTVNILGVTPLICNTPAEKAWRELLLPHGKKNAAEKALTLKHDPLGEFRASVLTTLEADAPTRLTFDAVSFKRAMASAATDIPGAARAQIGRLAWIDQRYIALYGVPQLYMCIVRSADMVRTPDVRSRALLPAWACQLTIRFMKPMLHEQTVVRLLSTAGMIRGVGDFRQEKGAGSYGQFRLASADDPTWRAIVATGGRAAQEAALEEPTFYDSQTRDIYGWYREEISRRKAAGKVAVMPTANGVRSTEVTDGRLG